MRARLGLPALLGDNPDMDADKYANESGSAQIGRHDAAAKALCYSSTFSDLVARTEPRRKYACHNGTDCSVTPDVSALGAGGVHDTADIAVVAAKKQVAHRIQEKKFGHGSADRYYQVQQQEAGWRGIYGHSIGRGY